MPNLTIRSDRLTAEVSPHGAELQRLTTADGLDLQWDGDPAVWSGRAPILFPVIGMLRDGRYRLGDQTYAMPKHGFAHHSVFTPVEQADDRLTLRLEDSAATRAIYPFAFTLDLTFVLDGASLSVTAEIANRSADAMPASFGFHPALRWPLPFGRPRAGHRIVFEHDEPEPIRRIDADGLLTPTPHPTPVEGRELRLRDDLFEEDALIFDRVRSRRVTYGAPDGPQLSVAFEDFPTLGVWTKPGAGYVCIEPWRGMSDPEGFSGTLFDKPGSFVIPPGGNRRLGMTVSLVSPEA